MLDRESTFAHPEIVKLLQTQFVPVALDQAYQRRQKDTEGDFYRQIASQGPRDLNRTTQGFYIASASGKLLVYNNNRDPDKVARLMKQALTDFARLPMQDQTSDVLKRESTDERYNPVLPDGGLVLRTRAKILSGYEPTDDRWKRIFQSALSRDNLWTTQEEHGALSNGTFTKSLLNRIARYHLVDNTRGEPPMWREDEIQNIELAIRGQTITGVASLATKDRSRGYEAQLQGRIQVQQGQVSKLDLVCLGDFWGEGPYTRGAPEGRFPLLIGMTLADGSDVADKIPPQGSRGWLQGYLKS